jgi:hypothetical protein
MNLSRVRDSVVVTSVRDMISSSRWNLRIGSDTLKAFNQTEVPFTSE